MRRSIAALAISAILVASIGILLAGSIGSPVGLARADNVTNVTGYYANATITVNNASYYQGRQKATFDNTVNMLTRLGTFVIGVDDSKTALSGGSSILIGLIVFGAVIGMSGWSRQGVVGGGVMAIVTLAGLVGLGLAPVWLWAVVLVLIAVALAGPVLRVLGT